MRMKRMIFITDSMTSAELDSDGSPFMTFGKDGKPIDLTWRVTRVARGSGTSVREVEELLCQYRMMANMAKQAGGKNGWLVLNSLKYLRPETHYHGRLSALQKMQAAAGGKGRGANGMPTPAQIQAMQVRMDQSHGRCNSEILDGLASNATRYAPANAETNERWWHAGNDEGYDARARRGPVRYGRDAT